MSVERAMSPSRGARFGRAGRMQARCAVPSPVHPGLPDGPGRPPSEADLERSRATALRVLPEAGMAAAEPLKIALA